MRKKFFVLLFGMCLMSISACGNNTASSSSDNAVTSGDEMDVADDIEVEPESEQEAEQNKLDLEELKPVVPDEKEKSNDAVSEDMSNEDINVDTELIDGMRPEFKEAMDSYEAFYDEYCDIMEKYAENPSDIELLSSYTDMLTQAAEMSKKFEAWEDDEMNDAELKYYLDVNNRVSKKLIDISQ